MINIKLPSVKSIHPWQTVIQTSYDIVKAHGGELSVGLPAEKVEMKEARPPAPARSGSGGRAGTDGDDPVGRGEGSEFIILLPV